MGLKVRGSLVRGTLRRQNPSDEYGYELLGRVIHTCGKDVALDVTGAVNYEIGSSQRAILRFKINTQATTQARQRLTREDSRFSPTANRWQVEFEVNRELWLVSSETARQ